MTTALEVRCINKSNRLSAHECIHSIGGVYANGIPWKLPQQEAIVSIEQGKCSFYVMQGSRPVSVLVAKSAHGNKYLKTVADGELPDNLLSLPECP
jgi:hypothetical protein